MIEGRNALNQSKSRLAFSRLHQRFTLPFVTVTIHTREGL
jgi:hypothetical protein